jgi:hypothetical protein
VTHDLTLADFSDLLQWPFPVNFGGRKLTFLLVQATAGTGGLPGGRQPFSLLFRGPSSPRLIQAMYEFQHPRHGPLTIFIVPLSADADGTMYEAVLS